MKPASLVRLYPPLWRARYGGELLALLESTPSSPERTRDVIRAAAWEWIRWTRVGRVPIAMLAGLIAAVLVRVVGAAFPPGRQTIPASEGMFWIWILVASLPSLAPTALLVDAARFNNRRQRFGFWTQLVVLVCCAAFGDFVSDLNRGHFLRSWFSNSGSCLFFLILLFNMERAMVLRRRVPFD